MVRVRAGLEFRPLGRLAYFCYQIAAMSISDSNKKRGRPTTGIGKAIGLRLYPDLESRIDAWIKKQREPRPSKPEAIRQILEIGLKAKGK
jgi:hypothetical protein